MKRAYLVAVALVLTACGDLFEPAAAVVNGEKITVSEVQEALEDFEETPRFDELAQQGGAQAVKRQFEQGYLSQLIRRAVLESEAEKRGIEVSPQEVQERIELIKQELPSEEAFEEALREQALTLEQLERLVRDQLLEEKLRQEVTADVAASEEELRSYYDTHRDDYTETRAQHILVKSQRVARKVEKELKRARPKNVDAVFARLAKKYSTDQTSAEKGGDLGYFSPGEFVQPFEQAANELKPGEVSGVVQTEFGFHVIRVTDRRVLPFDDVRADIEQEISGDAVEEAWQEWLIGAYRRADVEVNPRYGEMDIEEQQVVNPSAEDVPGAEEPSPSPTVSPAPTG